MSTPERKFQVLAPSSAPDRSPPCSEEAEQHVLAACLLEGNEVVVRALQAGITEKAFFYPAHGVLWSLIVELFRERGSVSVETVAVELGIRRQLEAVDGMGGLMRIVGGDKAPTTAHAGYFIEKVREKSALRMVVRLGTGMVEEAYAYAGGPLDDVFSKYAGDLSSAIKHARRGTNVLKLADQIDAVVTETTAAVEGKLDKSGWIYTGLPTFDERCKPFGCQRSDHFIVDAAGSGIGKSAFMRQVADKTLERGQRARIYTREDGIEGCIELIAASRVGVDLDCREGWTKDMLQKFTAACVALRELADKRLWCVEQSSATPMLTIENLEDDARYFVQTHGAPHLWIVDYLQIFGTKKRCSSREQEIAHVSHTLQSLCRELGGVWIVGCQMNEAGLAEMRTLRRDDNGKVIHRLPSRGDLRESQAIYHDADRVIAHYLPPVDSRDQDQTGPNILQPEVWICQIKRRKGRTGVVKTWFEKRYTRFVELPSHTHAAATGQGSGMTKAQFKGEKKA